MVHRYHFGSAPICYDQATISLLDLVNNVQSVSGNPCIKPKGVESFIPNETSYSSRIGLVVEGLNFNFKKNFNNINKIEQ